jgi:NAD(P) transhydrogenase subunit beta
MFALTQFSYIVATSLFIFALHWMNTPQTARRGVYAGVAATVIAVAVTWIQPEIIHHWWIVGAIVAGVIAGIPLALVPLTAVPQRTALSHAFGGAAAGLVGTAEFFLWYHHEPANLTPFHVSALVCEVLLGYLTFTGSLLAAGKLQELKWVPQRPVTYPGQNVVNLLLFGLAVVLAVAVAWHPTAPWAPTVFPIIIVLSLLFGVLLIIPIGGADMPTVISLLNSYAGLSAAAMGFVLNNYLLIIAGALDGSSGFILSLIMCRAMNRSFTNVLFGAFGLIQDRAAAAAPEKPVRSATPEEAASILAGSRSVIVVPGYGMAVAQAQHQVRELYDALMRRGVDVKFAIHPVAGRMPGHMNVLLAEADIPYDRLLGLDEANVDLPQTDVALVVGANDITNPAARHDKASPIYGMPILDVDKAAVVMVIKRSMRPGFAGVENELYYLDKTLMLFGDAKAFVGEITKELAETVHGPAASARPEVVATGR